MTLTEDRPRTQPWVGVARRVAEQLALDALARDRAGAEPHVEAQLLRDAHLPALLLPADAGGGGESWATALRVVREVATADGSIAQLLGYSYVNAANLVWVADDAGRARWVPPAAAGQWLWGDAVNPIDPALTLLPDGDGYELSGTKTFATGASTGDATVVAATVTPPVTRPVTTAARERGPSGAAGRTLLVVVRRGQDGVVPGGDWDNLGQRLSASGSIAFSRVRIEADAVLGPLDGDAATPRASLVTPAIQAVFGNLYLGITRGALVTAADYTRTTSRPWVLGDAASAAQDPYVLATYGRLVARLRAAEALADAVGEHLTTADDRGGALTWDERGELAEHVAALKVVASDLAVEATSTVFEVTGARATSNRHGLDRFWRNARTHTLHDPVAYKAREVGDHFVNGAHPAFTLYT